MASPSILHDIVEPRGLAIGRTPFVNGRPLRRPGPESLRSAARSSGVAQQFHRETDAFWAPSHKFSGEERERLLDCVAPHLRQAESAERALGSVAEAIGFFRGFIEVDDEARLQPRESMLYEIRDIKRRAGEFWRCMTNISPEARDRLTQSVAHYPVSPDVNVTLAPLISPRSLRDAIHSSGIISARAGEAVDLLLNERRPRGRPQEEAPALLTELCGKIWRSVTNLNTAPQYRGSNGAQLDGGPWVLFLRAVFEIAQCTASADYHARKFHERQCSVRK